MPIVSIEERFFKPNDYIGLRFYEGAVFARVDAVDTIDVSPYNVTDEQNTAVTVGAQASSTGPDITPKDSRNAARDLIGGEYLTANINGLGDKGQILHGAIGVFPSSFWLYLRIPAKGAGNLPGAVPGLAQAAVTAGDELQKMSGDNSPYHNPTSFRELVLTPYTDISIAYWNQEPSGLTGQTYDAEQPVLHFLFARYALEILRPALEPERTVFRDDFERQKAKRDNRLIKALVSGKLPNAQNVRFEYLPTGTGLVPPKYKNELTQLWNVYPIPDRAALLLAEDF